MRAHESCAAFGGILKNIVFLAGVFMMPAACIDGTEQPGPGLAGVTDVGVDQPGIPAGDRDCETVAAWAEANAGSLPGEYHEFIRFPAAYRRAIFTRLSPAAQSDLWQQHIQAYRLSNPNLSAAQSAFLHELGASISPELFAKEADTETSGEELARVAALEADAVRLFTQEQAHALLAELGPAEPARDHSPEGVDCHCSTESDWCDDNLHCKKGARGCEEKGGCGKLWMFTCDGMCGP
jgi:hypothetical protein